MQVVIQCQAPQVETLHSSCFKKMVRHLLQFPRLLSPEVPHAEKGKYKYILFSIPSHPLSTRHQP